MHGKTATTAEIAVIDRHRRELGFDVRSCGQRLPTRFVELIWFTRKPAGRRGHFTPSGPF